MIIVPILPLEVLFVECCVLRPSVRSHESIRCNQDTKPISDTNRQPEKMETLVCTTISPHAIQYAISGMVVSENPKAFVKLIRTSDKCSGKMERNGKDNFDFDGMFYYIRKLTARRAREEIDQPTSACPRRQTERSLTPNNFATAAVTLKVRHPRLLL